MLFCPTYPVPASAFTMFRVMTTVGSSGLELLDLSLSSLLTSPGEIGGASSGCVRSCRAGVSNKSLTVATVKSREHTWGRGLFSWSGSCIWKE